MVDGRRMFQYPKHSHCNYFGATRPAARIDIVQGGVTSKGWSICICGQVIWVMVVDLNREKLNYCTRVLFIVNYKNGRCSIKQL